MYSKLTVENNSAIKRFSHARRFAVALDILKANPCKSILDYGTGDGFFLVSLKNRYSDAKVFGYEPVSDMFAELVANICTSNYSDKILVFQDLDDLLGMQFDQITCLEVLEHLEKNLQINALRNMKKMLRHDGLLLISIPIEVGISSLIKTVLRIILGQKHDGTNLTNIIKAFLGIAIKRETSPYIPSHVGFNFHDLEKIFLDEDLFVKQKFYSPFIYFGSFVNSQIFYILSVGKEE